MRQEDLSREDLTQLTHKLKIKMNRFFKIFILAFFGLIETTELTPTEMELMAQMLAV